MRRILAALCIANFAAACTALPYVEPPPDLPNMPSRPAVTMQMAPAEVDRLCHLNGVKPAREVFLACTLYPNGAGLCVILMPSAVPNARQWWQDLYAHEKRGHCDAGLVHDANGRGWFARGTLARAARR